MCVRIGDQYSQFAMSVVCSAGCPTELALSVDDAGAGRAVLHS
jgi:hypothetical protein